MKKNLYKRVGIAASIMMLSVFLSRFIGLFREIVIAGVGGVSRMVDAYQVAFVIPEILNHVLACGFLSVTFIPIFTGYLARNMEDEGWKIFSVIFTVCGTFLLLLILVAMFFTPELIRVFAPGFDDPLKIEMAVRMTRIILPAQFFFFSGGLFMAVQFAKERFMIPALAPLIYNIGIIVGGFMGREAGMEGFAWGVLGGAFAGNFLVQYMGARKLGMRLEWCFDIRHPDLRTYLFLTLPLMLGLTMTFSTEFFLKFFGSFLPEGGISALNYGMRIMLILVGLFGQALGVASFPFLSRLAAEGKIPEMNRLMNKTLRYLVLVIPFSILFMVLRSEIVRILFERGNFDAAATRLTASTLVFLMVGAFPFAAQTVVVRGYYALKDTLFPTLFSTIAVLLSLPLYWFGLREMGIFGVATAIGLSGFLQVFLLFCMWNRRTQNPGAGDLYRFFGKTVGSAVLLGIFLEGFRRGLVFFVQPGFFGGDFVICFSTFFAFSICFFTAGIFFGIPEIADIFSWLQRKFSGYKYKGLGGSG